MTFLRRSSTERDEPDEAAAGPAQSGPVREFELPAEADIRCPPRRPSTASSISAARTAGCRLLQPVIVGQFRTESARTLAALRAYADQLG